MKINWGWALVIALASFMLFIGIMVFQLLFKRAYDHQLVSKNYYKDELLFQQEVNKLENAAKLPENIKIQHNDGKIAIIFPEYLNYSEIEGMIYFQFVMDEQFDFEQQIILNSPVFEVDTARLKKGTWYVKIDWKYQKVSYLLKEKISY